MILTDESVECLGLVRPGHTQPVDGDACERTDDGHAGFLGRGEQGKDEQEGTANEEDDRDRHVELWIEGGDEGQ